jgi:hypothetical protein
MKKYESVAEALSDLQQRGYEAQFESTAFCLYCGDMDIRLDAEDFHIDEVYRFEGDCSVDEGSIVYAITAKTGMKGTLVDVRGSVSVCKFSGGKEIDEQYAFGQG